MRKLALAGLLCCLTVVVWSAPKDKEETASKGKLPIQSIGEITFGNDHTLFLGDVKQGMVFSIEVVDEHVDTSMTEIEIMELDKKVAQLLGTTPDQVVFNDIAVHPKSQHVYISTMRGQGNDAAPVLLRASKDGKLTSIPLDDVSYCKFSLAKVPSHEAKDHRGRALRTWTITEMRYHEGALYVAGLSNEEFSSSLRKIPVPFQADQQMTSLEVFHGAHGKFETHSPIQTFLHTQLNDETHLLASYHCTPLVTFKQDDLKDGVHLTGKTIAELGAGNRPLAMASFDWQGETYYLISNNRRGLMRVAKSDVIKHNSTEGIKAQTPEPWGAFGVPYITVPFTGIQHMEQLNEDMTVCLFRDQEGTYNLSCGTRKIWMGIFE